MTISCFAITRLQELRNIELSAMGFMTKHTCYGNRYYVFDVSAEKKYLHCNLLLYMLL